MIYPKDDPEEGLRVLDLRGYEEYVDNKPIILKESATLAMRDIGLDYASDKDKIIYVIIPPNSRIANEVFKNFRGLQTVYNLNTCYMVYSYAFFGCSSLSNSNLSNCVYVDEYAFSGCNNLISVNLKKCESINEQAFSGCNNLISVNLKKCEFIGTKAFYGCSSLVDVDIRNADLEMAYESTGSQFAECLNLQTVRIKPGIQIPRECFSECQNLQTVYNLNKCTAVYSAAFYNCFSLSNSDLSNCQSIASNAFYGCSNVTFSNLKKCTWIEHEAFYRCSSLVDVDIRNAELEVSYEIAGPFSNCYNLENIKIKPGINIPAYTFDQCGNLQTVYNLNKCSHIGIYAFNYTPALSNKDFSNISYFGRCCFKYSNLFGAKINKNAKIASSTEETYKYSVFSYSNLDKIEIAYDYDSDDHYVLSDCYHLKYIKIPKGMSIPNEFFSVNGQYVDEIRGRTIYNFKYISYLGGWNLCNIQLTNNTILVDDPYDIDSNAFTDCLNTEWNLPNLTTEQVAERDYFNANSGVTFHCKDGDVTKQ